MGYLKRNKTKVILGMRKKLFKNVLSDKKARESSLYYNEPGAEKNVSKKLHVSLQLLSEKMKETVGG